MEKFFLLLGSHLFPPEYIPREKEVVIFEDRGLFTRFRFHKKRLVFYLESMRNHADLLKKKGYSVSYLQLGSNLEQVLQKGGSIEMFEVEDRFLRKQLGDLFHKLGISCKAYPSPLFLHTIEEFEEYFAEKKHPLMRSFYERERRRLGILMEGDRPQEGKYSFDQENRKPLPKGTSIPPRPIPPPSPHHKEVCALVNKEFREHPGDTENCWLPTTRSGALEWLSIFVQEYLPQFGPYEDAISRSDPFLFHSVLSPLLNIGLLTPEEVLEKVLDTPNIPLNSLEGFVRQLIGWREFIRGIDECFGAKQAKANFFKHKRKLTSSWYEGETGIAPLDYAIKKVVAIGYCHHIERLMILSNLMLLCEIDPQEVYAWFMELFVDSADWVMGPNVFGMGQFSDGGIFATKPYICGSNYLLKMSHFKKGPWCDTVDGLYWRFIDRHRAFFQKQPRLNMMTRSLEKMSPDRKKTLFSLADQFLKTHTQ